MIVRDGVEGTPFKSSEAIPRVWSWDSQHFAHVIRDDRGVTVLVDERPMGPYQAMLIGAEVFFDLDNRLIYAAQKQDRWCMMRDEEVLMAGTKGDVRVAVEENLDAVVNALMSRKK